MGLNTKEYCGTIIFALDGQEYEIKSLDDTAKSSAKPIKTMNRSGEPSGTSCGSWEYDLKVEAYIPLDGSEPDWKTVKNGTVTLYPQCEDAQGQREVYTGCRVTEIGRKSSVDDATTRSISLIATGHRKL